jgi:catechol 2,3-dioxygenase-like lactoylglutathione lyase family enzyme
MTLTADRLAACLPPSSLTTVPRWHPATPEGRTGDPPSVRTAQPGRGELRVYVEGAGLPWWFDDYLNRELSRLFALPAGWDGPSAEEVTVEAITEAVSVLAAVAGEAAPAPQFFPLRDGGIQVEWHIGGNDIEIEVNGAGQAYVFAARSDGQTVADGEVEANRDASPLRAVAAFLNELGTGLSLAHLPGDLLEPAR